MDGRRDRWIEIEAREETALLRLSDFFSAGSISPSPVGLLWWCYRLRRPSPLFFSPSPSFDHSTLPTLHPSSSFSPPLFLPRHCMDGEEERSVSSPLSPPPPFTAPTLRPCVRVCVDVPSSLPSSPLFVSFLRGLSVLLPSTVAESTLPNSSSSPPPLVSPCFPLASFPSYSSSSSSSTRHCQRRQQHRCLAPRLRSLVSSSSFTVDRPPSGLSVDPSVASSIDRGGRRSSLDSCLLATKRESKWRKNPRRHAERRRGGGRRATQGQRTGIERKRRPLDRPSLSSVHPSVPLLVRSVVAFVGWRKRIAEEEEEGMEIEVALLLLFPLSTHFATL